MSPSSHGKRRLDEARERGDLATIIFEMNQVIGIKGGQLRRAAELPIGSLLVERIRDWAIRLERLETNHD